MTDICEYEAKNQKQKRIGQSLFGNYYSALNYLSNGIQFVIFFNSKIFQKNFKNFSKLNENFCKWNNFTYCTPLEGEFNVE